MITVNGAEVNAQGKTLTEFLTSEGYDSTRVAVEKNGSIVPRAEYDTTILQDGDKLEIVRFVGGG